MYILAIAKRYLRCIYLENYLFNVWNVEFCKIPNFGTVTMKTSKT